MQKNDANREFYKRKRKGNYNGDRYRNSYQYKFKSRADTDYTS